MKPSAKDTIKNENRQETQEKVNFVIDENISDKESKSTSFYVKDISAIFDNMLDGFAYNKIILDENAKPVDMIIIEANKAYEKIIGIPRSEFIGKKTSLTFPYPVSGDEFADTRIAIFETFVKVALTGMTIDTEIYFSEIKKWLHVSAYSPKKYYFVSMFEDITKRKELEKKINDYTKDLEKIVEERTRQLKESERLATIGQTAGMIGHDIRNPLQAIVNELYIAKKKVNKEADSKEKKEILDILNLIQDQTGYISKIVADLQDYSRPLNPELSDFDLYEIISSVLQTIQFKDKVNVFVNITSGAKIKTDSVFFRRILGNLVGNSIQAMPEGGKLNISAAKEENQTIITVSDNGKGIPEEAKPKIFEPLFTTKAKGQGLGLAVVKRLVEALHGTITFESQEGKGTTFTVALPD